MSEGASISGGFSDGAEARFASGSERGQPLPESLEGPIGALLSAFDVPSVLGLSLTYTESAPEAGASGQFVEINVQLPGGGGWGFGVDLADPLPDLLVSLAYGIQEHLPEEQLTWGQARPPCPGHPHPAEARVVNGVAWWCCPQRQDTLRPVVPARQVGGPK